MPDLTINGHRHHYEDVGSGRPMIFIAGTRFDAAKDWVAYMEHNASGFRVIMPDIRGMAQSEHTVSPSVAVILPVSHALQWWFHVAGVANTASTLYLPALHALQSD